MTSRIIYAIIEAMTGVGDKLERLLVEQAEMKAKVEALEESLKELRAELGPVFFQANVVRFVVRALGLGAAVVGALATAFPKLFIEIAKLLGNKGGPS